MKRLWDKGEKLDERVHAFTVGSDPVLDLRLVRWDALASAAHARMLSAVGILSGEEEAALVGELAAIAEDGAEGKFEIPPALEDCHTAIEAWLVERCGEAGKKIHTGRSRNDQVLVAVRLFLRSAVVDGARQAVESARVFLDRCEAIGAAPLPGYTHFQPAMPSSVGMWLGGFAESFLELCREGLHLFDSLGRNPLGVGSGFGVPLPLDRELTAALLGFHGVQRNPIHVQNSRGQYELRVLRWMSDFAAAVEKCAWDIIVFSAHEFGFFRLDPAFTTGSSIMPQKRNPDVLELLRGRAAAARAAEDEMRWIVSKLPSSYHRDFQLTKEPLLRSIALTMEAVSLLCHVVQRLEVDEERAAQAMSDDLFSTYAAYRMVRDGKPFREAYTAVGEMLKSGALDVTAARDDFALIRSQIEGELRDARGELGRLEELVHTRTDLLELVARETLSSKSTVNVLQTLRGATRGT